MMGWYGGGWGLWMWVAMGAGMILFWGLVALLVVWLLRSFGGSRRQQPTEPTSSATQPGDQALRLLDERFARGDITEEEYRHRRDVLQGR